MSWSLTHTQKSCPSTDKARTASFRADEREPACEVLRNADQRDQENDMVIENMPNKKAEEKGNRAIEPTFK